MNYTTSEQDGAVVVKIEGDLLVSGVEAIHKDLLSSLATSDSTILDINAVKEIDTAGMQLLLTVVRYSSANNKKFSLRCDPQALSSVACRLGLSPAELLAASGGA